jgi:GNAT superfamily N-acetyltransferase
MALSSKKIQYIIREATLDDSSKIADFQVRMAIETESYSLNPDTVELGVSAVFKDKNKGQYIVAEVEGTVIASTLITYEWSDWRNRTIYWIQSVYVEPEYRSKGVFKAIYNFIEKWVKQDPTTGGIRLYVDLSNSNAQQVYIKLGMDGSHYQVFEWMKEE